MRTPARFLRLLFLAAAVLSLSACQQMKQELGMGRNSPDEFLVVKRAPLSLPPDYSLRPPVEGYLAPASDASGQAKAHLMGDKPVAAKSGGASEKTLLGKMGADAADPDIRTTINRENGYLVLENKRLADKLIFWKDVEGDEENIPSSLVDPEAEAQRLKENEATGKPVNAGDVPVIEKKQSTIDKLF